jgi:hypothetical protein
MICLVVFVIFSLVDLVFENRTDEQFIAAVFRIDGTGVVALLELSGGNAHQAGARTVLSTPGNRSACTGCRGSLRPTIIRGAGRWPLPLRSRFAAIVRTTGPIGWRPLLVVRSRRFSAVTRLGSAGRLGFRRRVTFAASSGLTFATRFGPHFLTAQAAIAVLVEFSQCRRRIGDLIGREFAVPIRVQRHDHRISRSSLAGTAPFAGTLSVRLRRRT